MAMSSVRDVQRAPVRDDRMVVGLIGEELADGNRRVTAKPACGQAVGGKAMRDAGVEADACDVEEQPAVQLTGIDPAFAPAESATSMALPDRMECAIPARDRCPIRSGSSPSVASRNASAEPTSLTVPSPPQARTSGRALRERSGSQLARVARPLGDEYLAVEAAAAISDAASSARSRATCSRPPVPEIGLMMTAARSGATVASESHFWLLSFERFPTRPRSNFGCTNHVSAPGRREVRLSTSMRQMPPFLNGSARPAPMRCAASSPRDRLVPDEGDAASSGISRELRHHRRRACARRQRIQNLDGRLAGEAGGQEIGSLLGANERAREDLVDARLELLQSLDRLLEARDASRRQRALVVVGPLLATRRRLWRGERDRAHVGLAMRLCGRDSRIFACVASAPSACVRRRP